MLYSVKRNLGCGLFAVCLTLSTLVGSSFIWPTVAWSEDSPTIFDVFGTRFVRVIGESELDSWAPRSVDLTVSSVSDSDKTTYFTERFRHQLLLALESDGFAVESEADTSIKITINALNHGKRRNKLLSGMLGHGALFGSIEIVEDGKFGGSYQFSSKARNALAEDPMRVLAEQLAPSLWFKLVRGIRDKKLHSYRNPRLKSS